MKVETKCAFCRETHKVKVSAKGYKAWRSGTHIQTAMPELSEDDRERLISGVCPGCWGEQFVDN